MQSVKNKTQVDCKKSKIRIDHTVHNSDFCSMENSNHFSIVEKAIAFIDSRSEQQPSLEDMASHVHMSKFHFQRVFKKWAGISPKDFLQYLTLEQAKASLNKGKSTLETAFEVGLSGNGRLHDLFINFEACTPGEYRRRGEHLHIFIGEIETPFGPASIAETSKGINRMSFGSLSELKNELTAEYPLARISKKLGPNSLRVSNYFKNWQTPEKPIRLDIKGTAFQVQVWKALLQIPSAQLVSYADIARTIDKPGSARAVGTAIGKNPVAYLIPCHRVIKNTGQSGEYRWGNGRKKIINAYEGARLV